MSGTSFLLEKQKKQENDRKGQGEAGRLEVLERLERGARLSREEFETLLSGWEPVLSGREAGKLSPQTEFSALLRARADGVRRREYGNKVFIRGLIECTNYCKNDCYYCGIRRSNRNAKRYRLTEEEILECCGEGYELGFRTFVLQGGEDGFFTDERVVKLARAIKARWAECALTLSFGEKSRETYEAYYEAGVDRYLLRHETADAAHYRCLHPREMSMENRMRCLRDLKEIGFQTGAGMMVGAPRQTVSCLADDLLFLQELQPEMVGIGPFLPHHETPFAAEPAGSVELTLDLLAIVRLMLPKVLLPATTALGTAEADGRERGMSCGANVVMPNLSPSSVRSKYSLYDRKRSSGSESAEGLNLLKERMAAAGFEVVEGRGDPNDYECKEEKNDGIS